jgi:hypothetical protein
MIDDNKPQCERCNRKLINFKTTMDWSKRRLHKSCWKKEQDELSLKIMLEQYQKVH